MNAVKSATMPKSRPYIVNVDVRSEHLTQWKDSAGTRSSLPFSLRHYQQAIQARSFIPVPETLGRCLVSTSAPQTQHPPASVEKCADTLVLSYHVRRKCRWKIACAVGRRWSGAAWCGWKSIGSFALESSDKGKSLRLLELSTSSHS